LGGKTRLIDRGEGISSERRDWGEKKTRFQVVCRKKRKTLQPTPKGNIQLQMQKVGKE